MNIKDNNVLWAVETVAIDLKDSNEFGLCWQPDRCFTSRKNARAYARILRHGKVKICPTNMQTRVKRYVLDVYTKYKGI
jgi:hypothetical protein